MNEVILPALHQLSSPECREHRCCPRRVPPIPMKRRRSGSSVGTRSQRSPSTTTAPCGWQGAGSPTSCFPGPDTDALWLGVWNETTSLLSSLSSSLSLKLDPSRDWSSSFCIRRLTSIRRWRYWRCCHRRGCRDRDSEKTKNIFNIFDTKLKEAPIIYDVTSICKSFFTKCQVKIVT